MITSDRLVELQESPREACPTKAELAELCLAYRRYSWLRQQAWFSGKVCVVVSPKEAIKPGYDCPSLFRLDDIIDKELESK